MKTMVRTVRGAAPPAITEAQFLAQVKDVAHVFGWQTFHPFLSKWSDTGWPDLALCRPPRLVLAELKSERGRLTDHQQRWLDLLARCEGVEVYTWRPADLPRIAEILNAHNPNRQPTEA